MSVNREIQVGSRSPKSRPVGAAERLAELVQGRLVRVWSTRPLGQHDAVRPTAALAVDGPDATAFAADAELGLPSSSTSAIIQLVEGSSPTKSMPAALRTTLRPPSQPTRYPARSGRAVGQLDVDAGVVLGEARHLALRGRIGTASSSTQPARMRSKSRLPQREHVGVAGREVADVQGDPAERQDRVRLALREEPLGDAALIEHLDGAGVQAAGSRAVEVLGGATFDDGDVDAGQGQLAGQHQPGRATAGDHHCVVHRRHTVVLSRRRSAAAHTSPWRTGPAGS